MTPRKPKTASMHLEADAHAQGTQAIVGIDEAGYGAWAGPVVAGAVCLPPPSDALKQALAGVRDSKTMTANQRAKLFSVIQQNAITWGIGHATNAEIDAHGVRPAARLAMQRALDTAIRQRRGFVPDCLFLDGLGVKEPIHHCEHVSIKYGDQLSLSIAAASVLAKVWRDDHMRDLDAEFPGYGFGQHKGYGTAAHLAALRRLGVSAVHRRYYRPIQALLTGEGSA